MEGIPIVSEWAAVRDEGEEKVKDGSRCHLGNWQANCDINHNEARVVLGTQEGTQRRDFIMHRNLKVACLKFSSVDSTHRGT